MTCSLRWRAVHEEAGAYDKVSNDSSNSWVATHKLHRGAPRRRTHAAQERPSERSHRTADAGADARQFSAGTTKRGRGSWLLGIAYFLLNRPDKALRQHQQSLEIARRIGYKRGVLQNLKSIAQLQRRSRRIRSSLEELFRSARLGPRDRWETRRRVTCSSTRQSLLRQRRVRQRSKHYREALQIQREVRNQTNEAAGAQQHRRDLPPDAGN